MPALPGDRRDLTAHRRKYGMAVTGLARRMDVGFIGLGRMGAEMANNLLKAGHRVTVYNRRREKMSPLVQNGAIPANSAADACRGEAVVTMLANDDAVQDV